MLLLRDLTPHFLNLVRSMCRIVTRGVETGCPNRGGNNLGGRASSLNLEGGPVNGGVGSTNREGGTLAGRWSAVLVVKKESGTDGLETKLKGKGCLPLQGWPSHLLRCGRPASYLLVVTVVRLTVPRPYYS